MKNLLLTLIAALLLAACATQPESSPSARAGAGPDSTILVFGASGRTGRYLLRELEKEGRSFRAVTSNAARAREQVGDQYDWVQADVRDPASLDALFDGVTTVISSLGATSFEGPNGPEFVDYQGVRNVVDAARRNGVQQMVLITASGVTNPNHPLNKMGGVMTWKLKGEDHLRASGLPYTIIRPGGLTDTDPGQQGMVLMQGDSVPYGSKMSVTSRGDLAALCIAALDDPAARFKTFGAFNDESQPIDGWRSAFASIPAE